MHTVELLSFPLSSAKDKNYATVPFESQRESTYLWRLNHYKYDNIDKMAHYLNNEYCIILIFIKIFVLHHAIYFNMSQELMGTFS